MDRVPIKTNPQLFDLAVAKIQRRLAEIPWLDYSIGICEKLTEIKDGKRFTSANFYKGDGRYEQIMPCKELGNFCFWMLNDPQTLGDRKDLISSPFSLILWYDTRKVSLPTDERDREAIKALVLGVLNSGEFSSTIMMSRIYEKPENIFKEFSYDYTNNQFLMSPYAGLRIDGDITAKIPCYV